jgi:hypothetical protein
MNELLDKLTRLLLEESGLQRQLAVVGDEKQRALIESDVPAIDRSNAAEQGLLLAVGNVAGHRLRAMRDAARLFGLPEAGLTLTLLCERLPEPHRRRVRDGAAELKELMARIQRTARQNRSLTEQSLRLVRDFFQVLGGGESRGTTYTRRGVDRPVTPSVAMINHVA